MSKFLRLLALSLFVTSSALLAGCNPGTEEADTTDGNTTSEVQNDNDSDTVASEDMVLVSLNVPGMA